MAFNNHLAVVVAMSWGHIKPILQLSARIVKERCDIVITIPVIGQFKRRADDELERCCTGANSFLKDHIRIVQISDFDGPELQYWNLLMELWPDFFEKLCTSETIMCYTGRIYPSIPKPGLCLIDAVLSYPIGTSMIKKKKVKVLSWFPGASFAGLKGFAPTTYGGDGDVPQDAKKLAEEMNISVQDAMRKLLLNPSGQVRKLPGLPAVYDYEFFHEYMPPGAEDHWVALLPEVSKFVNGCDGFCWCSTPIIEEGPLQALDEWLTSLGRASYSLGPCFWPDDVSFNRQESSGGQEISVFLDKVYESHGSHSLLYMSLGTSIFPSADTPFQLIDIILELNIPLILAMPHGDTFETRLPNDLRKRIESSECALAAKWISQQEILKHAVTGIFLTHGGQGSVTESLMAGVPMIVWPFQVDQPLNAMNLTLNLKVAYQLLEVRVSHGLKPLYRGYQPKGTKEAIDDEFRQVLKNAFGEDGKAKRKIAQNLGERLRATWQEGGEALTHLRRLLQDNYPINHSHG